MLVFIVALFFLAMGALALVAPERILSTFGVDVTTAAGRTEVRAVYGGYGIAVAAALLAALLDDDIHDGVLFAIALSLAGMALGRVISAMLGERLALWPTWFFCALEAVLAGALLIAAA